MEAKTKSEEIKTRIRKIMEKEDVSNSDLKYMATLAGHDNALVLKEIIKEIVALKKALVIKGIIKSGKVIFKEGKGRTLE